MRARVCVCVFPPVLIRSQPVGGWVKLLLMRQGNLLCRILTWNPQTMVASSQGDSSKADTLVGCMLLLCRGIHLPTCTPILQGS